MEAGNDNFQDEEDFLLKRAAQLLRSCPGRGEEMQCSLTTGGKCPLIYNVVGSILSASK